MVFVLIFPEAQFHFVGEFLRLFFGENEENLVCPVPDILDIALFIQHFADPVRLFIGILPQPFILVSQGDLGAFLDQPLGDGPGDGPLVGGLE